MVVEPTQRIGTNSTINPEKIAKWLPQFIQQAQAESGQLHDFKANINVSVTLQMLVRQLVECCWSSEQPICIFVDEGDEIRGLGWQGFEDEILDPLAISEQIRFVIALRGDQRVSLLSLSYSADKLPLLPWNPQSDEHEGQQQLDVLKAAYQAQATAVDNLLVALSGYERNHPGINTFLYELAQVDLAYASPRSLRDIEFLASLIKALNPQSPDNPQLISRLLLLLVEFAHNE